MSTSVSATKQPFLPPRWIISTIWRAHRTLLRRSGTRLGLRVPTSTRVGMLRLHAIGRRSGIDRAVVLCYLDDGPNLVTLAMNGWGVEDPAWWGNLQANPDATVDLVGGSRRVRARAAVGDERTRLWSRFSERDGYGKDLDAMASLRGDVETAVVVLEPRS